MKVTITMTEQEWDTILFMATLGTTVDMKKKQENAQKLLASYEQQGKTVDAITQKALLDDITADLETVDKFREEILKAEIEAK